MTEAKNVQKTSATTHTPETPLSGDIKVRIDDIAKRGRAWCVRICGKYHKMKGSYILEECPGCGSSAIKWSGIRNKRQSNEVSTLRCNRQGRGRCDHADARRRIQARAENRAKMEAFKQSTKLAEPFKRKSNSQAKEPPPSKAMPGFAGAQHFAPKMYTLAAAALHLSQIDIEQPPKPAAPHSTPEVPHENDMVYMSYNPMEAMVTRDPNPSPSPLPDIITDFCDISYQIPVPRPYSAFNPMVPPTKPAFQVPMPGVAAQHPAGLQSKLPPKHMVPLLMLQHASMRSHNPQVQQPHMFVPPQLVFPSDPHLSMQMNPQLGF